MISRGFLGALVVALAIVLAPAATAGGGGVVTQAYIGGTHSVLGSVNNVPGIGTLPLSTALAVCQQQVAHPFVQGLKVSTPGFGGGCAIPLPSRVVSVVVDDATFGELTFIHQAVDLTGEPCAPVATAASGATLSFPADCVGLDVWPAASATYGTIRVTGLGG